MAKSKIAPPRKPYPVLVPHRSDEPAYGLLVRTAYLNGSRRIYTVFEKFGIRSGQTVWDVDPELVAHFCKADLFRGGAEAVRAATPRVDPKHVAMLGDLFERDQFSVVNRRWCPACLEEDPYHRVWWDTPYVSACPDHGIKIVENCGCRTPPKWRRSFPTSCVRGHDFRKSPREPAPPWEIALSRYIRDRLLKRPRPDDALLDSLPTIGDAIAALDRIGQASLGEKAGLMKLRRKFGRATVAAEGYRIVSGFPAEFERLLDRLVADADKQKGDRQWGVEKAYGDFHVWVRDLPQDSAFGDALRSAMRDHARANVVIKSGHAVAGGAVFDIPGVDMTTAAEMAGVTFERFRRIATALGLIPKGSLRGRPARLDPDAVADLAVRLKGKKTRQEIAKELNIAPAGVARLVHAGVVPAIVDGKSDREKRLNIWLLPETAASDLLERLQAGKPLASGRDPDLVPITKAHKLFGAPLSTLLRRALDGRLAVRAVDDKATGLPRVLVSKSDAATVPRRPRVPGVTPTQFAREVGLHAETMPQLLRQEIVKSTKIGRSISITPEETERFRATYASTTQLAREFDLYEGRSVIAVLHAAGVAPACPRPPFRQVIYRRAEAEPALAAHVAKLTLAKNAPPPPEDGLDRRAAARHMGLNEFLLTQLVDAGLLRAHRLSRGFLIAPQDADAFMDVHVTATELAKRLGKRHATAVHPVLQRAGVKPVCGPPDFEVTLYPRASAEAAISAFLDEKHARDAERARLDEGDFLTAPEVCDAIGIGGFMLGQLRHTGFIQGKARGHAIVYPQSSVARFKEDYVLANELGAMIGKPDGRLGGKKMTELLIRLGVLPICARPEFYSYVFPRAAAQAALTAVRHGAEEADEPAVEAVTLREAQRRLGITSNMGSSLVREGFLKAKILATRIIVAIEEIERFRAAYITPARIAALIGKGSAIAATTLLDRLGVEPVAGPPRLKFQIYDRAQVEAAIARWKADPSIGAPNVRHAEDVLYAGEVSRRLRTVDSMTPALIKAGLLPADTNGKAIVVRTEDFEAFRREYAMANEFMDAFGVASPKGVVDALARRGIMPIATEAPLPRALFRRREVEKAVAVLAKGQP